MEKYLTVKEFSSYANVTNKAVYQRLDTSLKPYTKTVKGKKLIKASALKDIYHIEILENEDIEILNKDLKADLNFQEKIQDEPIETLQNDLNFKEHSSQKPLMNLENIQDLDTENSTLKLKVEYLEKMLENKQKELDREIANNQNLIQDKKFLMEKFSSLEKDYKTNLELLQTNQVKLIIDQTPEPEPEQEPKQNSGEKKHILDKLKELIK